MDEINDGTLSEEERSNILDVALAFWLAQRSVDSPTGGTLQDPEVKAAWREAKARQFQVVNRALRRLRKNGYTLAREASQIEQD